jgi:enoyl-CoA hydratase/carnithine racemase
MSPLVQTHIADGVATLTLDRPEKRNALDAALMSALAAALDGVRDDAAVNAVVLRGAGPVFSSGIDHAFLIEIFQKSQSAPFAHLHHDLQEVFHRMERMRKPVIAALHGACVGMAFELALACDIRVASADCVVGLPEIAFGIIPDVGGTTRLVRAVGAARAKELLLLGTLVGAAEAQRLGLVTEVVEDRAAMEARAAALAALLAARSSAALGHTKALVHASAAVDASTSFQLEGTVQDVLMRQPDLGQRFPEALKWIKAELARHGAGRNQK